MQIYLPKGLSRCDDRTKKAKVNPISGGPEDWFTTNNMNKLGYKSFSFDFFVNWASNKFVRVLWFKRFLDININNLIHENNWEKIVEDKLIDFEGRESLKDLVNFCTKYKMNADFLLFNDNNWRDSDLIIYARLQNDGFIIKAITLEELKNKIRIGTGRPFKIGRKGLIYSTSKLECYLSTTDTPYPGDADLVLVNETLDKFKIIEFKKHNLPDQPISQQNLLNYYPRPDGAKYNRLEILRKYLPNTEIYTIYYTTNNRNQTKIELNSSENQKLVVGRSKIISSPNNKNDENEIMSYLHKCCEFLEE